MTREFWMAKCKHGKQRARCLRLVHPATALGQPSVAQGACRTNEEEMTMSYVTLHEGERMWWQDDPRFCNFFRIASIERWGRLVRYGVTLA